MQVKVTAQVREGFHLECQRCHSRVMVEAGYATDCFMAEQTPLCLKCLSAGKRTLMMISAPQHDPLRN